MINDALYIFGEESYLILLDWNTLELVDLQNKNKLGSILIIIIIMQRRHKFLIVSLLMLIGGFFAAGYGFGSSNLVSGLSGLLFYGGLLSFVGGIIMFIKSVQTND
ncbi:hypothetical protein [Flavobacterium subsaxonicum]|uniref:Uncharacterized protein n=1 Tax=Flavobacterium subsaxonicum WB 4.1-42 = DSM 21790 TaxID=1121898 RepID=A0A0A2MKX3_9FLAO|nr:hypothetical protein [Flavobacterium subsaxonicum]KGO92123.1 hypothetical protein Q766_14635 [Flavobacterium subsaxonicum WB 4.1-42 = DSM 21790]